MELLGHHISVATEMRQFWSSFLLGIPAGILLDCFRSLRVLIPHHWLLVFVEDVIYAFACVFMLQCDIWMVGQSVFRWYYGLGMLLGLLGYLATAGTLWMGLLRKIRRMTDGFWTKIRQCNRKKHKKNEKNAENHDETT